MSLSCSTCAERKPASEFYRRENGKLRANCKQCHYATLTRARKADPAKHAARTRRWRKENPEKSTAAVRAWNKKNPKRLLAAHLKNRYGLSLDAYVEMNARQEGRCAICSVKPGRRLSVDHCHRTGKVRGLICDACNKALGLFKDDAAVLLLAAQYLQGAA